jgi:hypothetical protein
MWCRPEIAAGLLSFTSLAACAKPAPPPTERRVVIASPEAPFLNELEDDEAAADVGRAGEVVEVVRELATLRWEAAMGDKKARRDGQVVELRQAPGDAILFGFKVDLGAAVDVPTTAWICDAIARDPALPAAAKLPNCPSLLRRVRLPDGALAAFQLCAQGPCPVAVVRGGRVGVIGVDGIVKARTVASKGGLVLLASTRWVRSDGKWTGGNLVPIRLSGATPSALAPIPVDEVDARDAVTVVSRIVHTTIEEGDRPVVHITGDRRELALADARELARAPIDERVPIDR